VCDPDVALGQLFGRNRAFIEERIPHIAQLLVGDLEAAVGGADVVIVGKRLNGVERLPALLSPETLIVDLVGVDALTGAVRPWAGTARPRHGIPAAGTRS
jgi:GDP-mannose 6-dehydrogenase